MFTTFMSLFVTSLYHCLRLACSQSTPYITEVWNETVTNNFIDVYQNRITDVNQNCSQELDVFAETVANLTRCTVLNARPIRICTNCEKESNAVQKAYFMMQNESSDCYKFYFKSDQLGIINLVYKQGTDLWIKSYCQDCYININDTKEFLKVSKDLDACLKNFNESSIKELSKICDKCEELFVKMNNIYKKFVQGIHSDDDSEGICVDIVDQMNITRHTWSSQNCLNFDSNIGYPNIVTAVVVGCIPVFFYMLSKSISSIEDVKLVRPKRKSFASLQSESLPAE